MADDSYMVGRVTGILTSRGRLLGPDLEKGLADLKTTAEKSSAG